MPKTNDDSNLPNTVPGEEDGEIERIEEAYDVLRKSDGVVFYNPENSDAWIGAGKYLRVFRDDDGNIVYREIDKRDYNE